MTWVRGALVALFDFLGIPCCDRFFENLAFLLEEGGHVLVLPVGIGRDPGLHAGAAPGAFDNADGNLELLAQLSCEEVGGSREAVIGLGRGGNPAAIEGVERLEGGGVFRNFELPELIVLGCGDFLVDVVNRGLFDGFGALRVELGQLLEVEVHVGLA